MVMVDIWDDNRHKLVYRNNEKIQTVEGYLQTFSADEVKGIEKIWGCVNMVKITLKNQHINIHFTDKQFKKFKSFLEELNGGEIPVRYAR